MNDIQTRKWQLTINNPADTYNHDVIKAILSDIKPLVYWCMCDEIGEQGTYHTHIFLAFSNVYRFTALKKRFETAHLEVAKGTCGQNRDYITKSGKWEKDKKAETNLYETFEEFGNMPMERQGQRNDIHDLYDMIKQGMSNYDILELNPTYMLQIEKIERARQIVREEQFKEQFRELDVTYVSGEAGTGKTRGVMESFGYSNVYRVTDYLHPFDSYKGQDVIAFEEFHSSLKIENMLNYLDGYPLEIPCRYLNKIACYTKVYLISNIDLEEQYRGIQMEFPDTWKAFLRRLKKVIVHRGNEILKYDNVNDYLGRFRDGGGGSNPFLK